MGRRVCVFGERREGISEGYLLDVEAELGAGCSGNHGGIPGRLPDDVNGDVADFGDLANAGFHLVGDGLRGGAALRGEGHFNGNVAGVVVLHIVDEAEIHDVDRDFGIVALPQGIHDLFAGERHRCSPEIAIE